MIWVIEGLIIIAMAFVVVFAVLKAIDCLKGDE